MAKPESNQAGVDPFESFRRLWGPMGVPVPGLAMPTMITTMVQQHHHDNSVWPSWLVPAPMLPFPSPLRHVVVRRWAMPPAVDGQSKD